MPTRFARHMTVRVVELVDTPWQNAPLLDMIPADTRPLAWLGFRQSMVGWGRAAAWTGSGSRAIAAAADWWRTLSGTMTCDAPDDAPRAPIAFGSFGFSADTESTLIVPEICVIESDGRRWAATASLDSTAPEPLAALAQALVPPPSPPKAPIGLVTGVGRMTQDEWMQSVARLAERLAAGDASKAVMTRDMCVHTDSSFTERHLVSRLDALYPTTWRFAVDGLVGATPEMLASTSKGRLRSRVLAGTARPGRGAELMESEKNRREHALAVESVVQALTPIVDSLSAPDKPFILDLPNVSHLATDIDADLGGIGLLDAVQALHPTAAVCGTPRAAALDLLIRMERTQRGRYSGPVGWVDADGEGEFCIALRCGLIEDEGRTLRVFAGGGIMPDSSPASELAETRAKMAPLLDALGVE